MIRATSKQLAVLEFLKNFIAANGYPPTRQEIADDFGFKSPNAAESHLVALRVKKLIEIVPGSARGIRIVSEL